MSEIESIANEYALKTEPQAEEASAPETGKPQDANLQDTLSQVNSALSELNAERERVAREREEQELNALVDKIHKGLAGDSPDSVPKKLVKYALADRYNSDESFKTIVDGRDKSPEALEKAVESLIPEFRKDFAVKADPQIAEDQRAMSEGTRGSSSPSQEEDRDLALLRADQSRFAHEWEKIKRGL